MKIGEVLVLEFDVEINFVSVHAGDLETASDEYMCIDHKMDNPPCLARLFLRKLFFR